MKRTIGAIVLAAALAFAGAFASTPAAAANDRTNASNGAETDHAAAATDMSARRRHWRRHYRVVRPWPHVYPYRYGYYRPRPIIYPYSYGYYRPRPIYYRPYYAPAPFPFFSIGFGPRDYW
jgi:hypothetical protein